MDVLARVLVYPSGGRRPHWHARLHVFVSLLPAPCFLELTSISDCFFTARTLSSSSSSHTYTVSVTSPSTKLQWLSYAWNHLPYQYSSSCFVVYACERWMDGWMDGQSHVQSPGELAIAAQLHKYGLVEG